MNFNIFYSGGGGVGGGGKVQKDEYFFEGWVGGGGVGVMMKIRIYLGGHCKTGLFWGVISKHSRAFS